MLEPNVDIALSIAALLFQGTLIGARKYGWRRKSAGSRIKLTPGEDCYWLRVQFADAQHLNERLWEGEVAAAGLIGICKPTVLSYQDWREGEILWRATLMTFIEEEVCSTTQELHSFRQLPRSWFLDLRSSLEQLATVETPRICCRQDLVNRRVKERFGSAIEPSVRCWVTCHGDLHWANLTCPKLNILDWEVWGQGPKGLDPAFLLGFSLLDLNMCRMIRETFDDWLSEPDGLTAILFVCSELLRMIELYGDHPELKIPLCNLAEETLRSWRDRTLTA